MNIVREKEIGTLEQINVTPIKKYQFIIGKLFPFWVLGLVILTVGLIIAKVIFNVPIFGKYRLDLFLYFGLFVGYSRHWINYFKLFGYPTTSDVCGLVFYRYLYLNERIIYTNRKYASMGTESNFAQSDSLFCGDYPDGDAQRCDVFGYFQTVFNRCFLCFCVKWHCGLELQKSELIKEQVAEQ